MKPPTFVKVNEESFEIQLSGQRLTNESLRTSIEELEQFLRAEGTEKRTIDLDLTHNPEVTDDSDRGEGGFTSLVLFLRSFGSDVTRLKIGGTGISGNGLLSLIDFVKLGVAEELDFSSLPRVDESTALAVLTAVLECHAYPIKGKLPLLLRMDRIGLDDPKYILTKAFNDADECFEVLTETPELLAAQAARRTAECEAPQTAVMVSLPFFYSQEPEDDVTTPAPHALLTPPSTPEKPAKPILSLQTPEDPKLLAPQEKLASKVRPPSPPQIESGLPKAFLGNHQAQKVSPRLVTFDAFPAPPSDGPPPHLLWKAAPKSEMARKSLETQIKQSTSPKALSRTPADLTESGFLNIGVRPPPPPPRPKPSKSAALATPPPKLPSQRCVLPALPPPPPRPVAVEVKTSEQGTGGSGLRGVLEKVKEHGQSIWKGAQSATDEILSAPAFSAKTPTSTEVRKVPSPQQKTAQEFHAQEKLEPDEAGDDEKENWSWWKGRWWDWDSQEKRYIEVEQRDFKAHGWSHDLASHNWQNGSWQDWRPWSWSNEEQDQFWSSEERSFSNDGAEEKKACLSWTQSYSQDKPSCQSGWREDWSWWSDWSKSDWSDGSESNWWDSKEWIQERSKEKDKKERDEERHTDDAKPAKSEEKAPSQADSDMELDLVSGKEDASIGQWANLLRKWEDEKTEKLKELASSETSCREVDDEDGGVRKAARPSMSRQTSDDMESIMEEEEDEHEELIKRTREVLQRHRGEAPVQRSGKRGRSPLPQEPPYPPPKKSRRSGKAFGGKRAKARYAKLDDKRELSKVEVRELRYSQLSCKETFQCGRSVSQLVQDLLDRKVSLSAPFLRLTVFETTDEKTNEPILRCIDNRRLFALKEYAKKSGKDRLMVNVNLFSQNTLTQVQRFIQNSDDTDGRDVRLRKNRNDKRRQPLI